MPTVVKPQPHIVGRNRDMVKLSTNEVLTGLTQQDRHPQMKIARTSSLDTTFGIVRNESGFVHTVIRAFQQDLHLRLRPDDVWLAILIQFGFYVAKHEADLRHVFIAHEGKREVSVDVQPMTMNTGDFGDVARMLAEMVTANLKDAEIATTLLPEFTTTTVDDRAVAAVAFLGVMKQWFEYGAFYGCGFPSVTLLGERSDWASMLARVSWIGSLDNDLADWALRLTKVLEYMVASFDRPEDDDIKEFWMRAVHVEGPKGSSITTSLSGWLTAFCWWTTDGDRLSWQGAQRAGGGRHHGGGHGEDEDEDNSDEDEWSIVPSWDLPRGVRLERMRRMHAAPPNATWSPESMARAMKLGDVAFPTINREIIPGAIVEVPIKLIEGDLTGKGQCEVMASLQAGLVGMQIQDDSATTVQPISAWWLSVPAKF